MTYTSRVNVDDLGFYPAIEASVLELAAASKVPIYTSWVTNYDPPSPTFMASPARPFVGLHFNLLEGRCASRSPRLCDERGMFCRRWVDFLWPDRALKRAVEEELDLQCQVISQWFGKIDHCDSHLHLHALPWIHRLVLRAQRKYAIGHIRNPHEPLSDGPSLHPKLLLLWGLSQLHGSRSMPCYGISRGFRNTRSKCLKVLRKGARELVLHTQLGPFDGNLADFRFLPPPQILLRCQEHREVMALVSEL